MGDREFTVESVTPFRVTCPSCGQTIIVYLAAGETIADRLDEDGGHQPTGNGEVLCPVTGCVYPLPEIATKKCVGGLL